MALNQEKIEIIKAFEIKLKNKRFVIVWYNNNSVSFQTRTLQDFKRRIITTTSGIYSIESFLTLQMLFRVLHDDYDFAKKSTPFTGKLNKQKIIVKHYSSI